MNRTVAVAIGVVMVAMGALWTFQGLGYVGGSPMTGVTLWAVLGPLLAGLGVAVLVVTWQRRR